MRNRHRNVQVLDWQFWVWMAIAAALLKLIFS